jgi:hypothetical protein
MSHRIVAGDTPHARTQTRPMPDRTTTRSLHVCALALAILLHVSQHVARAQYLDANAVFDRCAPGVVAIEPDLPNGDGVHSGFFVSNDGWILTWSDVVRSAAATQMRVRLKSGAVHRVRRLLVGSDASRDLALVQIDSTPGMVLPIRREGEVPADEEVLAIGHVDGQPWARVRGRITRQAAESGDDRAYVQMEIGGFPGFAGAPIISEQGVVVGVFRWDARSGTALPAVRAGVIRAFLRSHNLTYQSYPFFNQTPRDIINATQRDLEYQRTAMIGERQRLIDERRMFEDSMLVVRLEMARLRERYEAERTASEAMLEQADMLRRQQERRAAEIDTRSVALEERAAMLAREVHELEQRIARFEERGGEGDPIDPPPLFALEGSLGVAAASSSKSGGMGLLGYGIGLYYRFDVDARSWRRALRPTERLGLVYSLHRQYAHGDLQQGYLHDLVLAYEYDGMVRVAGGVNFPTGHGLFTDARYYVLGVTWYPVRKPLPAGLTLRHFSSSDFRERMWAVGLTVALDGLVF